MHANAHKQFSALYIRTMHMYVHTSLKCTLRTHNACECAQTVQRTLRTHNACVCTHKFEAHFTDTQCMRMRTNSSAHFTYTQCICMHQHFSALYVHAMYAHTPCVNFTYSRNAHRGMQVYVCYLQSCTGAISSRQHQTSDNIR